MRLIPLLIIWSLTSSIYGIELEIIPLWEKSYYKIIATQPEDNSLQGFATFWVIDDYLKDTRRGILERLIVQPHMRDQGLGKHLFSNVINFIDAFSGVANSSGVEKETTTTDFLAYPLTATLGRKVSHKTRLQRLISFYESVGAVQSIENPTSLRERQLNGVFFVVDHADALLMQALRNDAEVVRQHCTLREPDEYRITRYAAKIVTKLSRKRVAELCELQYKTAAGARDVIELIVKLNSLELSDSVKKQLVACIADKTNLSEERVREELQKNFSTAIKLPPLYDYYAPVEGD